MVSFNYITILIKLWFKYNKYFLRVEQIDRCERLIIRFILIELAVKLCTGLQIVYTWYMYLHSMLPCLHH